MGGCQVSGLVDWMDGGDLHVEVVKKRKRICRQGELGPGCI